MHSPSTSHCLAHRSHLFTLIFALLLGGIYSKSDTQITLDGSLGPDTSLTGPAYIIPADVGQQHGGNLFHSFGVFKLHTGERATFTGPNSVHNVIGRVTSGQSSTIDGILRSDIPGANLFLLNPQGIMFGPNAVLDVSGSFHVSTADTLRFADGGIFAVGGPSTLTVATPAAFGFDQRSTPARITVDGSHLEVPEGETLSMIGGDLMITGDALSDFADVPTLDAPGGHIHLASVASQGEIGLNLARSQVNTITRFGFITVSDAALISTSGEQGGTVVIRGAI